MKVSLIFAVITSCREHTISMQTCKVTFNLVIPKMKSSFVVDENGVLLNLLNEKKQASICIANKVY